MKDITKATSVDSTVTIKGAQINKRLPYQYGLLFALLVFLFSLTPMQEALELTSHNLRFQARYELSQARPSEAAKHIVIAAIDDATKRKWEEPMVFWGEHYAAILKSCQANGAKCVGMDVIPEVSADEYLDGLGLLPDFSPDAALLDAIEEVAKSPSPMPVVWGNAPTLYNGDSLFLGEDSLLQPAEFFLSAPLVAGNIGFVELPRSADGIVHSAYFYRQASLLTTAEVRPSFAGMLFARYANVNPGRLATLGRQESYRKLPSSRFYINYTGESLTTIPAWKIAQPDQLSPDEKAALKDAIVLVGITFRATPDVKPVPFRASLGMDSATGIGRRWFSQTNPLTSGVEIQAQILATLIDQRPLMRWSWQAERVLTILCALIALTICWKLTPFYAGITILITILSWYLIVLSAFCVGDYLLPLTSPLLAVVVPAGIFYILRADQERQEKIIEHQEKIIVDAERRVREECMQNFLSPYVAQLIMHERKMGSEEKERDLTILFIDIRNSTGMAEKLPATDVFENLNQVFGSIVGIVEKNEGQILGYRGDGFLAAFGLTPSRSGSHAWDGLRTAVESVAATDGRADELQIGCGLHSGAVACGLLGITERCEYTTIGDTVNVAAKLEGQNKQFTRTVSDNGKDKVESVIALSDTTWQMAQTMQSDKVLPIPKTLPTCKLGGREATIQAHFFMNDQIPALLEVVRDMKTK